MQCRCSVRQIENYRQKISGTLLDRIDVHVEVPIVDFKELTNENLTGESPAKITTNSAMGAKQVRECCKLEAESCG